MVSWISDFNVTKSFDDLLGPVEDWRHPKIIMRIMQERRAHIALYSRWNVKRHINIGRPLGEGQELKGDQTHRTTMLTGPSRKKIASTQKYLDHLRANGVVNIAAHRPGPVGILYDVS